MKYLICERCFGYYELQEDESPEDFESCQCGGFLDFIDNIDEFMDSKDRFLSTKYICPNIYCNYKKPLNKAEDCPKCGSSVNGAGFNKYMGIVNDNVGIDQNKQSPILLKCPNQECDYEGILNGVICPECGVTFEKKEKNHRPQAFALVTIKGSGGIQKGDFFYRTNDD
jgi:hypothetical protein